MEGRSFSSAISSRSSTEGCWTASTLSVAFKAQAALSIEEIGEVGLLECCLLGQPEAGEFACIDALPKDLAKTILQDF
jgi:hypothetical protein